MSNTLYKYILPVLAATLLWSCSTTSGLDPDEQLYTGLKPIQYGEFEPSSHYYDTRTELEAALAMAPNGALFGSSYYRSPLPYGLWIYNWTKDSHGVFKKWLNKTFGSEPVVLSNVNPELRVSVAESVLKNHGYFRGTVDYDVIYSDWRRVGNDTVEQPRKAKIAYKVNTGNLFTLDSIRYSNFPAETEGLNYRQESLLHKGDAFSVNTLDEERARLYNLFRNHGYYFYKQSYSTYLADTLQTPGKVQLNLHCLDSLPEEATRKWVIGRVSVNIKRTASEELTDSVGRRFLTIHFGGRKSPLRPGVVMQDVQLRPGQLFSQDSYEESLARMATKGIYQSTTIDFSPRTLADGSFMTVADTVSAVRGTNESRAGAGVLDMAVNCLLDKPYDFILQANYLGKTSNRMGPGLSLGFAKRNAFRGGELLTFNLAANYEFQLGGTTASQNSYEISGDVSLTIPRLVLPKFLMPKRRRWQVTPQTLLAVSRETINRSGFFRRHILSGEFGYTFQPTIQSRHQFSPIIVEFDRMAEFTQEYANATLNSPILLSSLDDYFMSKMRYSYSYSSPTNYKNPIFLSFTVTESSNLLALGYAAFGRSWNETGKHAFKVPFSQFVKAEAEWRKTWQVGSYSSLVAHAQVGIIKVLGNSTKAPFSECYYIGGANNLRAFSARSIGPGSFHDPNPKLSYLSNVGDTKLVANIEYRPHILGALYGAVFVDAGNVWNSSGTAESKLKLRNLGNDIALGAGIGVRYDLDFFTIRVDWGFALHTPYDNGHGGYFNIPSFGKAQCLNFAIGYPF